MSNEDYEKVKAFGRWRAQIRPHTVYAISGPKGVAMHRIIMQPTKDMDVHHKNHNGLHNYRGNLEVCSRSYNLFNSRQSPNRGISIDVWGVYVVRLGRGGYIGRYKTLEKARQVRDEHLAIILKDVI